MIKPSIPHKTAIRIRLKTKKLAILVSIGLFTVQLVEPSVVPEKEKALKDAFGRPFAVTDVVDIGRPLAPAEFRSLIGPSRKLGPPIDPKMNSLTRDYFFGRYTDIPDPVKKAEELLAAPHAVGMLGKKADPSRPLIVADDIPFRPILREWPAFSQKYYPRRMTDWFEYFRSAFLLTGREIFRRRGRECLDFLLYSQYRPDGSNPFVQEFYPRDSERLKRNGLAQRWRGGWDYLFDWEWKDVYGYQWSLHEPDHHVCSATAVAMIHGWLMEGDRKYLESAEEFTRWQLPDYGFHSGEWNGRRYYWTQYDRSGQPNSATSATDNIVALVARAAAMLGYYRRDAVLLEYTRGLLWYLVREFKNDGRWYYDGAENPLNLRRAESHEMVVVEDSMVALAFLLKAGMPMDEFMRPLGEAIAWYRENSEDLKSTRDFQLWEAFSRDHTILYLKINAPRMAHIELRNKAASPQSVSRLIATPLGWKEKPADLAETFHRGEILKITCAGVNVHPDVVEADIPEHGRVAREATVLASDLMINGDNFPTFAEQFYFPTGGPDHDSKK